MFVSGNRTTLQTIIDCINDKSLNLKIELVVSNNDECYAIKRANDANIETFIIKDQFQEDELSNLLKKRNIQLIVLAGYLKKIDQKIIKNFLAINTLIKGKSYLKPKYKLNR